MTQKLYIVRGLPGSGKSTLAKTLISEGRNRKERCSHFEADMFFLYEGLYTFQPELIKNAHSWCYENVVKSLLVHKDNFVVVSNTFTQVWEYERYLQLCKEHSIEWEILYPTTPWAWDVEECFNRNTHNVPKNIIQKMKDRFEK